MATILVDTCILSTLVSKYGPPQSITEFLERSDKLVTSVVTTFEVEMGLRKIGKEKVLDSFAELLDAYEVKKIPFSSEMAELAAYQGARMLQKGRVYSIQDLWIGATARHLGMSLATTNIKDFDHWGDLEILNPQ